MVASLAIMTILMGAIASALVVSARAIPANDTPLEQTAEAVRVVQQVANDLAVAIEFKTRTSNSVTFTIADRNNDTDAETITYSWSGSDGAPLLRKYNNQADETLLDAVSLFDIGFSLRDTGETVATSEEGAETVLASHTSAVFENRLNVTSTRYLAECFRPSLPADAQSWSITRAFLMLNWSSGDGTGGSGSVQIRSANKPLLPTGNIIDSVKYLESSLSGSAAWVEFTFADAAGLDPAEDMCIVITGDNSSNSARVTYDDLGINSAMFSISSNQGGSWTDYNLDDMLFSVYGKVVAPGADAGVYQLTTARIKLQLTGDDARIVETSTEILNAAEIIQ